jgi:CRISPR-associated protein Cmx8
MTDEAKKQECIILEYNLYDLPTAQHKAGLAGLVLFIRLMNRRGVADPPQVLRLDGVTAHIQVSERNLQALFDDLYDAIEFEEESKTKWQKKTPKRIEEVVAQAEKGKSKTEKRYYYDVVRPKGAFLEALFPDGDGLWLKLWRDMLWETFRGVPKTRRVYEERVSSQHSSQIGKTWKALVKAEGYLPKGKTKTESIASSLFVGAQNVNAERVPFQGIVQQNLLLHFSTLVSLIFAPRVVSADGKTSYSGYVLAIPEPADLEVFLEEVDTLLRSLDTDSTVYRPKAALIDFPEEGGLEYLYHLGKHRVEEHELAFSVSAVELYYMEKRGNNIKTLAADRVLPDPGILDEYNPLREACRNPLYKTRRLRNLLRGLPWYAGMESTFNQYPWEFFVHSAEKTPRRIPFFGRDVRREVKARKKDLEAMGGDGIMSDEDRDDKLALRIYQLIRSYVNYKTEEKSGEKYQDFKNHKDESGNVLYPRKYREARSKVCSDAFLAMRSRRDQDFIEYFTGSICSVSQFLPEQDYLNVSHALIAQWDKVKTLSMLALSAHSYLSEPRQQKGEEK